MEDDPDKLKGPGGLTLKQVHEHVRKSVQRDREAQAQRAPTRPQTLWQRLLGFFRGSN